MRKKLKSAPHVAEAGRFSEFSLAKSRQFRQFPLVDQQSGQESTFSFSWPDGVWLKHVSLHSSHFHSPPHLQLPRPSTDCQTLGLFSGKGFHDETLPHTRDQFVFTRLTFWMLLRATLRLRTVRRWLFDELRPVMLTLWSTVWRLRATGWRRLLNVCPGRSPGLWCTWSGLRTGHSRDLH